MKLEEVYLKDKFATKIFKDNKEYVIKIIKAALKDSKDILPSHFEFVDIRINDHLGLKDTTTDIVGSDTLHYFNCEINMNNTRKSQNKNFSYLCQLILRDLSPGREFDYKNILPVVQINLNAFDYFGKKKFVYTSSLLEEELNLPRTNLIKIIDIDVDILRNMDYTKVMNESDDSLEKLLYIFVCDSKDVLDKVYVGNKLMEGVIDKMAKIARDIDEYLYYNKEEFDKACLKEAEETAFQDGRESGIKDRNMEIAKKLLELGIPISKISEATGLSEEEIKNI